MIDKKYCISLLKEFIAIPSISLNEKDLATRIATEFDALGIENNLQFVDGNCCNVTARIKGSYPGPRIIIGGHLDTVPAAEGWTTDPYSLTEKDGRMYGLGAGDMQGGLAACISTMRQFISEKDIIHGELLFVAVGDEERHSLGANRWCQDNVSADFAILAEPHFDNLVIGATGKTLVRLNLIGKTGHASHPEEGVNAASCMASLIKLIDEKYNISYSDGITASHCVLKIESKYEGYSLSIPDTCEALINKQLFTTEDRDEFISDIQNLFKSLNVNATLEIEKCIPSYSSYVLPNDIPQVKALLESAGKYGITPRMQINQSVSDGNIMWSELKIPTVLFGPMGINFHKPNEFLVKDSLFTFCDILEDFLRGQFKMV